VLSRIESTLNNLRRRFSRRRWAGRLLGLDESGHREQKHGLVMVQIDGLSRNQLEQALGEGRMHCLQRLLSRERYRLWSLYSGIPSTTPAVQGELFYGERAAVPAFAYYDREDARVRKMYEPSSARKVEDVLRESGSPLFSEGSIYCDVYTGGATEPHFCPAALQWRTSIASANPFKLLVLAIMHLDSVLRIALLATVELGLAVVDFLRGALNGQSLKDELKFVVTRIFVSVVLRELIVIGTKIDMDRGLPTVHINFLGYDEQAHRRGPDSKFARWTLKGIDRAVARIWRAAHAAGPRDYDVWVYSDHGQERVRQYPEFHGQAVDRAVENVMQRYVSCALGDHSWLNSTHEPGRGLLPGHHPEAASSAGKTYSADPEIARLHVISVGPVGLIYCDRPIEEPTWRNIARDLAVVAEIPLVMRKASGDTATAWTSNGEYTLPRDAARVLGRDHPFLDEAATDLVELCHHDDAGDLVFSGWDAISRPCSFGTENGAHAGPGSEETHAFALLPVDVQLPSTNRSYLRPVDLYRSATDQIESDRLFDHPGHVTTEVSQRSVRIMTYNVHTCVGMDAIASPERIARVINSYQPDIVCLQEIDVGTERTGMTDQASEIARYLQMRAHFLPTLNIESGQFGNAILTHLPMRLVRASKIAEDVTPWRTPRGAIWATIDVGDSSIQVINTHFGLSPVERRAQVDTLLGEDWLDHPECAHPVVVCGDLNATENSYVGQRLSEVLDDAQAESEKNWTVRTFPGRYPVARIDHIYVSSDVTVRKANVGRSTLATLASDHLPVIVDIVLGD